MFVSGVTEYRAATDAKHAAEYVAEYSGAPVASSEDRTTHDREHTRHFNLPSRMFFCPA